MGLSDIDPIHILLGLLSLGILGLLIWLCVLIYKWYKNPRLAPVFIQNIYYYFKPRSYDKVSGIPLNLINTIENNSKWVKVSNSSISNCVSNCNTTPGCNVFIHSESAKVCVYEKDSEVSDSTVLIQPGSLLEDITTYVAVDGPHPAYSYIQYINTSYTSPTSNIMTIHNDLVGCAKKCGETTDCTAFTIESGYFSPTSNCTLVNSTTSKATVKDMYSFSLESTSFSAASFSST